MSCSSFRKVPYSYAAYGSVTNQPHAYPYYNTQNKLVKQQHVVTYVPKRHIQKKNKKSFFSRTVDAVVYPHQIIKQFMFSK